MKIILDYNHKEDNFIEAIGCTEDMYSIATATIVYETICPNLKASTLYDDVDEVPAEFIRTKSQVLENSLKHVENDPHLCCVLLLTFERTHDRAMEQFKEVGEFLANKSNRIKADSLEDAIKQVVSKLKLVKMVEMISQLKEIDFDYDKFINFCLSDDEDEKETPKRDYTDIDDMIKKAMNDIEDETEE